MITFPEFWRSLLLQPRTSAFSIVGRKETNEDRYLIQRRGSSALVLVADGVGGHKHGEYASSLCVGIFARSFDSLRHIDRPDDFLRKTVLEIGRQVVEKGKSDPHFGGCGTTVAGFMLVEENYYTLNVGDSRVYRILRNGDIVRLTVDHTFVHKLVEDGLLQEELSRHHPDRHLMYSAIGQSPDEMRIDVGGPYIIGRREAIVVCTDGVHDTLRDNQISHIVSLNWNGNLARALVNSAYEAGSVDNITVCAYVNW